jgi:hypothetical protein
VHFQHVGSQYFLKRFAQSSYFFVVLLAEDYRVFFCIRAPIVAPPRAQPPDISAIAKSWCPLGCIQMPILSASIKLKSVGVNHNF